MGRENKILNQSIMTTETTKIKDLKAGDRVLLYGGIMYIISDARESRNNKGLFVAQCVCEDKHEATTANYYDLIHYDSFQGNEKAIVSKIINL